MSTRRSHNVNVNAHVVVNVAGKKRSMSMTKDTGLSEQELAAQGGEELPDREQMSLVNANLAAPINAAVALNALSDGSTTIADATQSADITQAS